MDEDNPPLLHVAEAWPALLSAATAAVGEGAAADEGAGGRWGTGASPPAHILPARAAKSPAPGAKGVSFSQDLNDTPPPQRLTALGGNYSVSSISHQSETAGRRPVTLHKVTWDFFLESPTCVGIHLCTEVFN